jgi:Holliday junction DNA helicase RuvA
MYEAIRGTLLRREPASAVVEAGGLAYLLQIPLSTYEALPATGDEVTLRLHLAVRDDDWRLFGFGSDGERGVFRALLRVSGVGPVMALSLLSGFRPKEFRAAVAGGDIPALTRVKGVGKKTAERIVVELRDAWQGDAWQGEAGGPVADGTPGASGPVEDAIRALQSLGLDALEARKRVTKYAAEDPLAADASDLIRKALRG